MKAKGQAPSLRAQGSKMASANRNSRHAKPVELGARWLRTRAGGGIPDRPVGAGSIDPETEVRTSEVGKKRPGDRSMDREYSLYLNQPIYSRLDEICS